MSAMSRQERHGDGTKADGPVDFAATWLWQNGGAIRAASGGDGWADRWRCWADDGVGQQVISHVSRALADYPVRGGVAVAISQSAANARGGGGIAERARWRL